MGFGGGGGGGYVPPPPPPPEKPQVSKPVTEAATAARQAQKDKASKAAGIRGSVFTDPLSPSGGGSGEGGAAAKTLLGR